jgi:outer membrane protein OmpA-like peptidoglycan-associated protein
MKKIILVCIFFITSLTLYSQELFRFQYTVGQRFLIEGYVKEDLYKNDILVKTVELKNVGRIRVSRIIGEKALHEGYFEYYTSEGISGDFVLEERYPTSFYRDIYGNYEIEDVYFMPVVRGVPTFPKTTLSIGDQWKSRAFEAHDFRRVYGITKPVIFPAAVSYQYLGNSIIDGEKIANLSINYVINYTLKYHYGTSVEMSMPYRVIGYFNQLYLWNIEKGIPHSYKENFDYVFIMTNGDTVEYAGTSTGTLLVSAGDSEQEYIIETIQNRLREKIPSVEVTGSEQGIVINVGEILFKFDSDELTENASDDLNNIVDVLREFNDRKIRVIGHTDSTGPEDYNLSLSLRRAKRTATELRKRSSDFEGRVTYIGMGESKPIASNDTEDGRRKNRRVEIIILNP